MKIIEVIPSFGMGGAEIMCETLIYELRALGHEVIAVSLYNMRTPITERLEKNGVDIRYMGKKSGLDFSMSKKIKQLLENETPDVVHTHLHSAKYVLPMANSLGIKRRIHTVHNMATKDGTKLDRILLASFFKRHGVIPVALSEIVQASVANEYKLSKESVPVIYNGADLSKCHRKKDYRINGKFRIVHVGRFSVQKNHIGLIDAFEVFHAKHPDSELILVGDGELRAEIESRIAQKGLDKCISLTGIKSEVYDIIATADIFALPSVYEGIPITLIEAMGTGLPIVASRVGGIPDMIADGENGVLCDLTTENIAKKFEMLYKDELLRKSLGEAALIASERFSSGNMGREYERIMRGSLNE